VALEERDEALAGEEEEIGVPGRASVGPVGVAVPPEDSGDRHRVPRTADVEDQHAAVLGEPVDDDEPREHDVGALEGLPVGEEDLLAPPMEDPPDTRQLREGFFLELGEQRERTDPVDDQCVFSSRNTRSILLRLG
jgi:hypothetical protein